MYFYDRKLSVPKLLPFNNGCFVKKINELCFFAYEIIDGKSPKQVDLSNYLAQEAAILLSNFFKISSQYETKNKTPINDIKSIHNMFINFKNKFLSQIDYSYFHEIENFFANIKIDSWLEKNEKGLVHGDYFFENILLKKNKIVGIIDFGDVYYGNMVNDLVIGAMEFSVDTLEVFNLQWMQSFLGILKFNLTSVYFLDLMRLNCIRFMTQTIPDEIYSGHTPCQNRYLNRFKKLHDQDLISKIENIFIDL
ncbi:phosphotransferase [Silvanigrella aquatica]|uniref:Aminoglycoside phosphotransferase domain-containing protein n=1 Tax=Silvanigrella aquatica TaxID=1915309 RepID=A0A1L4CZY5_9BACT|nr:phosphotransferase [Silvanigrella aquatica]APJ03490.1 hypothetical protein AXG55_06045 [Silvanigrella aquatica]